MTKLSPSDQLLKSSLEAGITTQRLRAEAEGRVIERSQSLHYKGCKCGICDGTGEWPGGGVTLIGWIEKTEKQLHHTQGDN